MQKINVDVKLFDTFVARLMRFLVLVIGSE